MRLSNIVVVLQKKTYVVYWCYAIPFPLLENILSTHPRFGKNQSRVTQRTRKTSKTSEDEKRRPNSRLAIRDECPTGPLFLSRGTKLAVKILLGKSPGSWTWTLSFAKYEVFLNSILIPRDIGSHSFNPFIAGISRSLERAWKRFLLLFGGQKKSAGRLVE